MATKKAGGSVKNGRDSWSKRLGFKKNSLEDVKGSSIIIRGFKDIYPIKNVIFSRNYNLVSKSCKGFSKIIKINGKKYVIII